MQILLKRKNLILKQFVTSSNRFTKKKTQHGRQDHQSNLWRPSNPRWASTNLPHSSRISLDFIETFRHQSEEINYIVRRGSVGSACWGSPQSGSCRALHLRSTDVSQHSDSRLDKRECCCKSLAAVEPAEWRQLNWRTRTLVEISRKTAGLKNKVVSHFQGTKQREEHKDFIIAILWQCDTLMVA